MNESKPYFLYVALAVPAILSALVVGMHFHNQNNGDLGNWGHAMIVMLGLMAASDLVGVICSGISVVRRERFRGLGLLCLGLYSIPLVIAGFIIILQFGATRGQQVMNHQAQQLLPGTSR